MNNDNDDPSLISLSDSFEDDSLLLDTDNPIFARPPPVNPSARNPFAKPVVKTAQAYLDLKNSDIYDVDDDDEDEEQEKRVEVVQKSKDIKNMKNNTKPKNSRDPTIELIEIDDDDDDDDYLNHTGLSQSMMSLRTRTPLKNASTPRRTSPRKASTFNRDLVEPIDLDPIDHMIRDTSPIRPRASSIVSSPKKKPRTTPPDEMIVVDLTMEEDGEELKKQGQRSRSRSRSAAIRKAFHFDDSLDFLTATNRNVDLATMNDDGDDGDKSIRPTVPITRNIRRKESSIRRKGQTSTNEIHIDLTLDSPMVDDDEDVIEIVDDEKVSTVRVATTSTVTTSETISRNDSSNLIEESTISTTTTSINTSSTRFSDIKARFDALVKRSSGASSTFTIPAPKEDELDLRSPGQSTQERELIHELEDMSSFSTSDFTILKERRSEDQPGPSRDDWFELDDDDDDDLGPPIGMGIEPGQRLPKNHSTPFPPITSTTYTVPAPKATKPRAKKANRQLLSGKKVTKLKGTTSKTTTKTTSKNPRRVNQNLFTEDLDEDLDDDDEQGHEGQESTGPKQPVMKQSDAIRHITVHVPAAVLELAPTELPKLKIEKELDYAVVEDCEDEDEMELCVRWKARPILEQMLKEVDGSVKVQRSSGLLDHLLVVVQAGLLHDCVGLFVESLKDKDSINSNDIPEDECDLYGIVHKCCTKYGIHNVTVVLHGVESYLKSQRSQANRSFRRRLKNLMAAEQNGVDAAQVDGNNKKTRTKKKKDQPEKESRIELTLDNIEMCLIDARMRFYYAHDEAHAHFGTVHVDSEEDLAKVIYQYTRSLSEQIFRLTKTRSSCIDFYAVHDKMVSIDPNTAQNRKDLWLRQLQQFPSISAMSAELIAHCFTSPKVMFDALRQSEDPVKMLAETGIGRKKIGLELACKIVQFMTTVEPDLVLKSLTGCTT